MEILIENQRVSIEKTKSQRPKQLPVDTFCKIVNIVNINKQIGNIDFVFIQRGKFGLKFMEVMYEKQEGSFSDRHKFIVCFWL